MQCKKEVLSLNNCLSFRGYFLIVNNKNNIYNSNYVVYTIVAQKRIL